METLDQNIVIKHVVATPERDAQITALPTTHPRIGMV